MDSTPEPDLTPAEPFADASDSELEAELLAATSEGTVGRLAQARVTAIRTVLRVRKARRRADDFEREHAEALAIVNAARGPDRQLSELHPVDVASVLVNPEWAVLVASDEELRSNG